MRLLRLALGQITPELRKKLCEFFLNFREIAKQTENPWDDAFAELLIGIFKCE